jgi:hypothetical protein
MMIERVTMYKKNRNFTALILMAFFFLSCSAWAQEEKPTSLISPNEPIFRGFIWDLPPEIIMANEEGTFVGEEGGIYFYIDEHEDQRVTIGYEFRDNQLWRGRIYSEKHYVRPQDRLDALLAIQQDLTTRYGPPLREEFIWKNNFERNHPENWGWAVYRGHLEVFINWEAPETIITAYLGATEPLEPRLYVTYEKKGVQSILEAEKLREDLVFP